MNIKAKILYYLSTLPSTLFEGDYLSVGGRDMSAYGHPCVHMDGDCAVNIIEFLGGACEAWYGPADRLQRNWTVTINIGEDTVRFDCIETAEEASRRRPVKTAVDSSDLPF